MESSEDKYRKRKTKISIEFGRKVWEVLENEKVIRRFINKKNALEFITKEVFVELELRRVGD